MPTEVGLLGAGGHAKVVLDALRRSGEYTIRVFDHDPAKAGSALLGVNIEPMGSPRDWPALVHVSIGDNATRARFGAAALEAGRALLTVIHPHATVAAEARVGPGCFIAAGAVVAPDAELGRGVVVNHGAVVDHDCVVGDWSHIAPGATLGGAVRVGPGTLVGSGAVVLLGMQVGENCRVGAGSVVNRAVPDGMTAVGVPARTRKNR